MEKKEKKSKKKFLLTIIIILFIIMVLLFIFRNNIEAQYKGVDPKYIENPQYCEQDSDCAPATCRAVNIYNFKLSDATCEVMKGKPICKNNICTFDEVIIPNE